MLKALVSGSSGFIGSNLVRRLRAEGWEVVEMDLPFDVVKKDDWLRVLPGVDYIFHLAGYLDDYYVGGDAHFGEIIDTNVKSVALLFEVIVEQKLPIKKIIAASSQSVYGDSMELEDECDLVTPISCYGASKAAMENVLLTLGKIYEIPVVAMRYSIVLGAGQKFKDTDSRILPAFISMARQGEIVTHEDGMQERDFVHVDDVVDAHLFLTEKGSGVYNIGSGMATTVKEVARYIADKFGARVRHNGQKRINTARRQVMSIEQINALGWNPKKTWRDAVEDYLKSEGI